MIESDKIIDVRFIALDLDGTLLNSRKEVSEVNLSALNEAMKANILISFASGRSIKSMTKLISNVLPNGPVITYNGAKIYNQDLKEIIYQQGLIYDDYKIIIDYCINNDFNCVAWADDEIYANKLSEKIIEYSRVSCLEPIIINNCEQLKNHCVDKIILIEENEILQKIKLDLQNELDYCNIEFSCPRFLEFFHINASKGEAIKRICEYYQIDLNKTMAFGDNYNDLSMLNMVKYPIVMNNAPIDLKDNKLVKNLFYVTSSNDEDGISKVIRKYVIKK